MCCFENWDSCTRRLHAAKARHWQRCQCNTPISQPGSSGASPTRGWTLRGPTGKRSSRTHRVFWSYRPIIHGPMHRRRLVARCFAACPRRSARPCGSSAAESRPRCLLRCWPPSRSCCTVTRHKTTWSSERRSPIGTARTWRGSSAFLPIRWRCVPGCQAILPFANSSSASQQVTGEALAHQELPFEQVVQTLSVERRLWPALLATSGVRAAQCLRGGLRLPGLEISRVPVDPGTAKFELTLIAVDQADGPRALVRVQHRSVRPQAPSNDSTSIIKRYSLRSWKTTTRPFNNCHSSPTMNGNRFSSIGTRRRPNIRATSASINCLKSRSKKIPRQVALRIADEQLTYRQLNQRANQLAHYLQQSGVGRETPVAICLGPFP